MAKFSFDKWLGRASGVVALWPLIPAGIIGVIAAVLSRGVVWIDANGPFGWLIAGLVAFLITSVGMFAGGAALQRFAIALATRKWARDVQAINPLEGEFRRQRINILDLVHPFDPRVRNKRFIDCELIGRTPVVFMGCTIQNAGFIDCDMVIMRTDIAVPIKNAVVFENCTIFGGTLVRCVVLMDQGMYETSMRQMGVIPITYERPPANPPSEPSAA